METNGSEFFYYVPGLLIPKKSVSDTTVKDIEFFVEWLQNNADSLHFLYEHHMQAFIYTMKVLGDILESIHARRLVNDVSNILKTSESKDKELCSRLISTFLVNAHTLAIEIQMAQRNKVQKFVSDFNSEAEKYADVISVSKIIISLLKQSDFEKAVEFTMDTDELRDGEYGPQLLNSMIVGDKKRAVTLMDNIISVFTKKIDDINRAATEASRHKTLVIVDDMPEILTTLYHMLKDYYHVFAFTEGFQALNFIDKKHKADVFLLDLDMPGMDGFALAQSIRDREKYKTTPILILTSHSAKETILQAQYYDVEAFIVKPANRDIIISKLNNCFNA